MIAILPTYTSSRQSYMHLENEKLNLGGNQKTRLESTIVNHNQTK